jgi:glycosyltransferase involved in cell wall biosynthesis
MPQTANSTANKQSSVPAALLSERVRVLILDLWCYIPYYDRYLCEALSEVNVRPQLAASSYYLDPEYFRKHGVRNRPGMLDLVAKLRLSNQTLRRLLMLLESCLNMSALALQLMFATPDILHIQWIPLVQKLPFDLWFIKLARKCGAKIVYTVHNVLPHDTNQQFKEIYGRIYAQSDALICHTHHTSAQLQREFSVDQRRIWVIPHGPLFHDAPQLSVGKARSELGLSPNACVVLMQGMLKPYKGADFLLDAWREVQRFGLNAQLIISGPAGPEQQERIQSKVAALEIHNSVRLDLRFISDHELGLYYQAADILVYPYRAITASGALMTGLAYGRAIIATDLAAFREVLADGESALLVKYGDVGGLTGALAQLIRKPGERARLAAAASATCSQLGWPAIAALTRNCYLATLGRRKESRWERRPEDGITPAADPHT